MFRSTLQRRTLPTTMKITPLHVCSVNILRNNDFTSPLSKGDTYTNGFNERLYVEITEAIG